MENNTHFEVAIIGAGPGGLSAAGRAANYKLSHMLFEASDSIAKTITDFQRGKFVMDEPTSLKRRSDFEFTASSREETLAQWETDLQQNNVNIKYNVKIAQIIKNGSIFKLVTTDNKTYTANNIVLAIGLQGNLRTLGVSGDESKYVQYTLQDPGEYSGETIVVVGAGDAAIENALALTKNNDVFIINRKKEFSRVKSGNLLAINDAINNEEIRCLYGTNPDSVVKNLVSNSGSNSNNASRNASKTNGPIKFNLKTANGIESIECNRIIARLGAIPPRAFVEAAGVQFSGSAPNSLPLLSDKFETNVPGLYIVGALAGYPLIKQALNQGWDVVEYILGNEIEPADQPALEKKLKFLPYKLKIETTLKLLQNRVPMFGEMNSLQFREFISESNVHTLKSGELIYKTGDYSSSFYTLVDGEVVLELNRTSKIIDKGQFFGEASLISGRQRIYNARTSSKSIVIETPRRAMNKLILSSDSVKNGIDLISIARLFQERFSSNHLVTDFLPAASLAKLTLYRKNDAVCPDKNGIHAIHIVRKGSLAVAKSIRDKKSVTAFIPAGNTFGELSMNPGAKNTEYAYAAVGTETIQLNQDTLVELAKLIPDIKSIFQDNLTSYLSWRSNAQSNYQTEELLSFFIDNGISEATDALIMNESLCIGCDNCENACADTHSGISRLDRKLGPTMGKFHIPIACRHCEIPHCMIDCPPNVIQRKITGEVYIDSEKCISCGNCVRNCPYDAIKLEVLTKRKSNLIWWLLTGFGNGPGENKKSNDALFDGKKAVKCDLCKDIKAGPACVNACPTGAAIRIKPEHVNQIILN